MWSSNSGQEHKIFRYEYTILRFDTICLRYIKTHKYKGWELKKDRFLILTTLSTPCGDQIVVVISPICGRTYLILHFGTICQEAQKR